MVIYDQSVKMQHIINTQTIIFYFLIGYQTISVPTPNVIFIRIFSWRHDGFSLKVTVFHVIYLLLVR